MSSYSSYGKHVTIDENNPQPIGFCDRTGYIFLRKDLVKDMQWRGNELVWTGFWVGRPYADQPNPSNVPAVLKEDPESVRDARPGQFGEMYANLSYTNKSSQEIATSLTAVDMMKKPVVSQIQPLPAPVETAQERQERIFKA